MAEDTAAARDRVLAARAGLETQLELLEASARDAVDIPAKIKRSPAKAAAVAGGLGFLALKGPQRVFGAARRAVRGSKADYPNSMLPSEIDKTLRKLGDDGDKVRGTLERDFAAYVKKASTDRRAVRNLVLLSVARPILAAATRAAAKAMFTPEQTSFDERLAAIRERFDPAAAEHATPGPAASTLDATAATGDAPGAPTGNDAPTTSSDTPA